MGRLASESFDLPLGELMNGLLQGSLGRSSLGRGNVLEEPRQTKGP